MAVTVITSRFGATSGHVTSSDTYANADDFVVDGLGHLVVSTSDAGFSARLAAYKPGCWIAAYVGDEPAIS